MHHDGFPHHHATVNGVRLHYVRQGAGAPLLLVHGWPGFYYEWHLNVGPLSERFDVIAPDMRGFAYSDKPDLPPEQGYTDTVMAGDLLALIDHLGFERVSIVAHDFGASWAQRFARTYPDRLEKIVLFDPPYPGIGARWFEVGQLFHSWYMFFHQLPLAEQIVGASRETTRAYISHFLSAWSADKQLWTGDEIDEYVEAFSQPGALRGGFNCYRAALRGGGQGGAEPIKTPTLVLWGDSDSILPYAWSDKLGDYFPNLTLKNVAGAGHFMMREAPERVNREIIDFLS